MANTDAPKGFRPIRYLDGTPYNGAAQRCVVIDAVADDIFIGSPVKLAAAGGFQFTGYADGNQDGSFPGVDGSDTTEVLFGIVSSFEPFRSNLETMNIDASARSDAQILVAVATSNLVFEVQGSEAMTGGLAVTGSYVSHSTETADPTATNISDVEVGQTGGAGWRVIGPVNQIDNDPTLANALWEVVCVLPQVGVDTAVAAV